MIRIITPALLLALTFSSSFCVEQTLDELSFLDFDSTISKPASKYSLMTFNIDKNLTAFISCNGDNFMVALMSGDSKTLKRVCSNEFIIVEQSEDSHGSNKYIINSEGNVSYKFSIEDEGIGFQNLTYAQGIASSLSLNIYKSLRQLGPFVKHVKSSFCKNFIFAQYKFEKYDLLTIGRNGTARDNLHSVILKGSDPDRKFAMFELKSSQNADLRLFDYNVIKHTLEIVKIPHRNESDSKTVKIMPTELMGEIHARIPHRNLYLKTVFIELLCELLFCSEKNNGKIDRTLIALTKVFYEKVLPAIDKHGSNFLSWPNYERIPYWLTQEIGEDGVDIISSLIWSILCDDNIDIENALILGDLLCLLRSRIFYDPLFNQPDVAESSEKKQLMSAIIANIRADPESMTFWLRQVSESSDFRIEIQLLAIEVLSRKGKLHESEEVLKIIFDASNRNLEFGKRLKLMDRIISSLVKSTSAYYYLSRILTTNNNANYELKFAAVNAIRELLSSDLLNDETRRRYLDLLSNALYSVDEIEELRYQAAITYLRFESINEDFSKVIRYLLNQQSDRLREAAIGSLKVTKQVKTFLQDLWICLNESPNLSLDIYYSLLFGLTIGQNDDLVMVDRFIEHGLSSSDNDMQRYSIELVVYLFLNSNIKLEKWDLRIIEIFERTNDWATFYRASEFIALVLCNGKIKVKSPEDANDKNRWHLDSKNSLKKEFIKLLPEKYKMEL